MTFRIAGAMVSVIVAVCFVAAVAFAVDLLDLEHDPIGIVLIGLAVVAGALLVAVRLRRRRRVKT